VAGSTLAGEDCFEYKANWAYQADKTRWESVFYTVGDWFVGHRSPLVRAGSGKTVLFVLA